MTASHKPWCSIIFAERKLTVFGLQHLLAACPCLSFLSTAMLMGGQGSIAGMTPTAKVCGMRCERLHAEVAMPAC